MFSGRYNHQIDAKGRLSVPSKFRDALAVIGDERLVVTNFDECLWVYPMPEWQELEKKVANFPQFSQQVKALERVFISAAIECPLDKQGRILIPPSLREYAALENNVVIIGMMKRFEIWSRDRWELVFKKDEQMLKDNCDKLAELGL